MKKAPPATHTLDFTPLGNHHIAWCNTAEHLLAARGTLREQRKAADAEQRKKWDENPKGPHSPHPRSGSLWIEIMLLGFAVENLLKAHWLFRGNKLYEGGELVKDRSLKNHDLPAIADYVGVAINAAEREALGRVSYIMTGAGRYPLGAKPHPKPRSPYAFNEWHFEWDPVVDGVIKRLQGILGQGLRPVLH